MWFRTQDESLVSDKGVIVQIKDAQMVLLYANGYTWPIYRGPHESCVLVVEDIWRAICAHKDHFVVMKGLPEKPEIMIEDMGFDGSCKGVLIRGGFRTLTDLEGATEKDLLRLRQFGKRSLKKVVSKMAEYGTSLKDDVH